MPTEIFYSPSGAEESRLVLEDDGLTMTYWQSSKHLPAHSTTEILTVDQARARFPHYAKAIDEALENRLF